MNRKEIQTFIITVNKFVLTIAEKYKISVTNARNAMIEILMEDSLSEEE